MNLTLFPLDIPASHLGVRIGNTWIIFRNSPIVEYLLCSTAQHRVLKEYRH